MKSKEANGGAAAPASTDGAARRRPYTRPELIAYGPLAKLTRGSLSGLVESAPVGKKAMK